MKKDILNAKGDVFNAKGDVFNAKGDVFNAKGDVFKAKGDVFNAVSVDNPLKGKTQAEVDAIYAVKPYDEYYKEWLLEDGAEEAETSKSFGTGFFNFMDRTLGLVDTAADIKMKLEGGIQAEDGGIQYDAKLGYDEPKNSNTIWYVAGGVIVLLIVVGVIVSRKKK